MNVNIFMLFVILHELLTFSFTLFYLLLVLQVILFGVHLLLFKYK